MVFSPATDLRIVSVDILFAEWAALWGHKNAHIPQASLDREAFRNKSTFWRNQFLTLNYRFVIGEILVHGRAIMNTVILVIQYCPLGALCSSTRWRPTRSHGTSCDHHFISCCSFWRRSPFRRR